MQKFALKLCTKLWDQDYQTLLTITHLPSLESRRHQTKLYYLYKIIIAHMYFPDASLRLNRIITMLSDLPENIHSYLSSITLISMGNHTSPIQLICGTHYLPAFKLAHQSHPLSKLSTNLLVNTFCAHVASLCIGYMLCTSSGYLMYPCIVMQ